MMSRGARFSKELKQDIVKLLKQGQSTSDIRTTIKRKFNRNITEGSISIIRRENQLQKPKKSRKKIRTIYVPKCLMNRLFPRGTRSEELREIVDNFFEENLEPLFLHVCKEPDFNIITISLKPEQDNLLNILKEYKLFPSVSEACRFIIMHYYLNSTKEQKKGKLKKQ